MMRLTRITLSLLVVALVAAVSQASVSDVSVLGNGSLTTAGGNPTIRLIGDADISGAWVDIVADDVTIDADATVVTATATETWALKDWWTGAGYTTTVTANFTIDELLDTENLGDWATDDITITFALYASNGSLIDSDVFSLANSVADGTDLSALGTAVSLQVTTPVNASDGGYVNWGTLKLTVSATASAFTAEQQSQDPDPDPDPDPNPVIPAPGAIALASLGMGLVGWLRTRRTL